MKYPKGPWRIGDAAHTIFGPPNGNPSPETIARLAGSNHRANAQLIAKAPAMYEALKRIAQHSHNKIGGFDCHRSAAKIATSALDE